MTLNATSPRPEHAPGIMEANDELSVSTVSHADGPLPNSRKQAALEERRQLGKKETRAIWWLRIVVLLVLVSMAVVISVSVYLTLRESEEDTFEEEFKFYAGNVIHHFNRGVESKLNSWNTLSDAVTLHAIKTNSTFPFVTLPDFETKGCNSRIMGDHTVALYIPYVSEENRFAWEEYSRNNNGHVRTGSGNEERAKKAQDAKFGLKSVVANASDAILLDVDVFPVLFFLNGTDLLFGNRLKPPYFPVWQVSPVLPPRSTMVNVDAGKLPDQRVAFDATMESGEATIANIPNLVVVADEVDVTFDLVLQYGQYRHRHDRFLRDPVSPVAYPVFDHFGEDRSVVGIISSALYWRYLFSRMLPKQIRGIHCVIENTIGQQVTFQVDGLDAHYVGVGDLHDRSFDSLGESIVLQEYMRENASPESKSFTMVDLNQDILNYTLKIYPSQEFKDIYVTNEPGQKAAAIAMIFVAILLVFGIYEWCVQRRQRIVLDRAVKATAAVSVLFPENVREHVINEGDDGTEEVSGKKAFLNSSDRASSRPLVEKHAECTVVFLDLDGFTKWSSTRGPVEVFELLETVFKEFDSIAQRRGVFKVETIGHSYLAVTGLPEEQADHAVRMAKFASDCLWKLDKLTIDLKNSLGDDVEDMTLRIGMHSGEITSGVFRGEKTRYQLVGDTVNTASRMQSTGAARHIQCSQSTADKLVMAGKSSWLIARVEKVKAKGKGEMQTYFIRVPDKGAKSQGTSDTGAPRSTTSFTSDSRASST